MTLTARETEALREIVRRGGSLPGGRENTKVTARLVAKGMVVATRDARRFAATDAGVEAAR